MRPVIVRRGYTFMELMIIMVILGILLALAVPSMGGFSDGARLKSSARAIVNACKLARTEAIMGSRMTMVLLNVADNTFRIDLKQPDQESRSERLSSSRKRGKVSMMEATKPLETRVRFDEISATDGQILPDNVVAVRFYPDGTATPTMITLVNQHDKRITVEVLRMTGLTELSKGTIAEKQEKNEEALAQISQAARP